MVNRSESIYPDLIKQVNSGEIKPLYVLYGEDRYMIQSLISAIESQVIEPSVKSVDALYHRLKGQSYDLDQLNMDVHTMPFMSKKRLIVLQNTGWFKSGGLNEKQQAQLIECMAHLPDSAVLIFDEEKVDSRQKKLCATVRTIGVLAHLEHASVSYLVNQVQKLMRDTGLKMSNDVAKILVERCGQDLLNIHHECEKIRHYALSQSIDLIDIDMLDLVGPPDLNAKIYEITQAMGTGRTDHALEILMILKAQKTPAIQILVSIARRLSDLIVAQSCPDVQQLEKRLKVARFIAVKLLQQSRTLSLEDIKRMHALCFQYDVAIKTGEMDEWQALETIIVLGCQKK